VTVGHDALAPDVGRFVDESQADLLVQFAP
jgi:hypothetical protein